MFTLGNRLKQRVAPAGLALGFVVLLSLPAQSAPGDQQHFSSPNAAMEALVAACRANDTAALVAMLGPDYAKHLKSIDDATEKENRARFAAMAAEITRIESRSDTKSMAFLGRESWPFPAPLVKESAGWRFDTDQSLAELRRRRIGENELHAIEVCREYLNAQREYAMVDRDADGAREYAQKILSTPGNRDGLYWDAAADEAPSPLGPLLAGAIASGKEHWRRIRGVPIQNPDFPRR